MRGKTVWVIGDHLTDYLAESARAFIADCHVARVVLMTKSDAGGNAILALLDDLPASAIEPITYGDAIEAAMDKAVAAWGRPTTILSTPAEALPPRLFGLDAPLTPPEFRKVVAANLTHHFRVARKASLYDGCQLVLTSPDVPMGDKSPAFALANFIKTTLHAFTATLAVENERHVMDQPLILHAGGRE